MDWVHDLAGNGLDLCGDDDDDDDVHDSFQDRNRLFQGRNRCASLPGVVIHLLVLQ